MNDKNNQPKLLRFYSAVYMCKSTQRFSDNNQFLTDPRLNVEGRVYVLAMLDCGRTKNKLLGVLTSFIRQYYVSFNVTETGDVIDKPRSGRPRVTSLRQNNLLRQRQMWDRFVTAEYTSCLVVGYLSPDIQRNFIIMPQALPRSSSYFTSPPITSY